MSNQDYTKFWHQNQNFSNERDEYEMRHIKRQSWNSNGATQSDGYSPRNPMHGQTDKRYVPVFNQRISDEFQKERNSGFAFDNRGYMNERFARDQVRGEGRYFGDHGDPKTDYFTSGRRREDSDNFDRRSVVSSQPNRIHDTIGYSIYRGYPASEPGEKPKHKTPDKRKQSVRSSKADDLPEKPNWMKTFDSVISKEDENLDSISDGKGKSGSQSISKIGIFFKLLVICLIIWDLVNDWLITGAGPVNQIIEGAQMDQRKTCMNESIKTALYSFNNISSFQQVCLNSDCFWMALIGFAILGSLITVIQVINVFLELLKQRFTSVFQIFHGQSEICLAMFLKELPQAVSLAIMFYSCDCSSLGEDHLHLYVLLASVSSCFAYTFRYISSFNGVGGDDGCCNNWWRCCCCRDTEYCCHVTAKDTFCTCEFPVPFCCCTATCKNCKWAPKTWCAPLLKSFSCYCSCCRTDEDLYGIRLVNLFLLLILWVALALQILFYVIFYSF